MAETGFQILFPIRRLCVLVCIGFYRKNKAIVGGKMLSFLGLL